MKLKEMEMPRKKYFVFVFDCADCDGFYGDQSLTKEGELLCPSCLSPQRINSPYVEKVEVDYTEPFDPSPIEMAWL
jgi:hypothetical protein